MSLPPDTNFCFESSWMADLYADAIPRGKERVFSWVHLVDLLNQAPAMASEEKRRVFFSELLPEEHRSESRVWLKTIDILREGWVLSHEDIDFSLDALTPTPKNVLLREVLHRYLDSPLSDDNAARAHAAIERVRSQPQALSLSLCFVPGPTPGLLFQEMAKVFAAATDLTEIKESWELGESLGEDWTGHKRPLVLSTLGPNLMEPFARALGRRPQWQTVVTFLGASEDRALLRLLLHHHRLPFVDRIEDPGTTSDGVTPRVQIVPFHPLALPRGYALQAYYSPTRNEVCDRLVLKEEELGALQRQGIQVKQSLDERASRQRALSQLLRLTNSHRTTLWTPSGRQLPDYDGKCLRYRNQKDSKPSAPDNHSYVVTLANRALSATQFETFARCPSQYLFGQRLRLRKVSKSPEDNFALWLGQATHTALESVVEQNLEPNLATLMDSFEKAIKGTAPTLPENDPIAVALRENFRLFAQKVPSMETALKELFGPATSHDVEVPFVLELEGISITGKIDRLDRLSDNRWLLLDYKTGSVDFTPDHIAKGTHYQALIYLAAMERIVPGEGVGILFYDLKKGELKRGLIRSHHLRPELMKLITRGHTLEAQAFSKLIDSGLSHVHRLAKQIRLGVFAPTPNKTACEWCDFPGLCRRAEGYDL